MKEKFPIILFLILLVIQAAFLTVGDHEKATYYLLMAMAIYSVMETKK